MRTNHDAAPAAAPIPLGKAVTVALPTAHVTAMIDAMTKANVFEIEWDHETAVATFTKKNGEKREVFRALKKGAADAWIIRHHKNLFA